MHFTKIQVPIPEEFHYNIFSLSNDMQQCLCKKYDVPMEKVDSVVCSGDCFEVCFKNINHEDIINWYGSLIRETY